MTPLVPLPCSLRSQFPVAGRAGVGKGRDAEALRGARLGVLVVSWLVLGCAGVVAQTEPLNWRQLPQTSADRSGMVFDSVRGRFVLQGRGTWEWDGANWRERHTAHRPNAQKAFGLAFDSARGRTVLFGGMVGSDPSAEVWEYDGVDWTRRQLASGPQARWFPAMTYDSLRGQVVIFGGYATGATELGDTWTLGGTGWTQVSASGPRPGLATMAFHAASGTTVLLGRSSLTLTSETWLFDGSSWRLQASNHVPPPETASQVAWSNPASGSVRLLGGTDPAMWEWNGNDWFSAAGPTRVRGGAAIASDPSGTTLVTGGLGLDTVFLTVSPSLPIGDTWQLQAGAWTRVHQSGPDGVDILLSSDFFNDRVLCTSMAGSDRRTFTWAAGEWTENQAAQLPRHFGANLSFDMLRGRFVQFGGGPSGLAVVSTAPTADLFEFDGTTWTQVFASGPSPRSKHAMATDFARGEVLVFGGSDGTNSLGDTWLWNGSAWRQGIYSVVPPARFGAAAANDMFRTEVVLFGGSTNNSNFSDTWLWNGFAWRQATSNVRPPARRDAALAFDFARGRTILCGGQQNSMTTLRDQWAWDGSNWTQIADGVTETLGFLDRSSLATTFTGMLRVVNGATWFGSDAVASTTPFGAGCGSPPPALLAFGEPVLGTSAFAVDLERAGAGVPFALALGHGSGIVQLGNGCALMMPAVDLSAVGIAGPGGRATYPVPVPALSALRGLTLAMQAGTLQPAAPLGFALSNGLSVRIGD